MLERNKYIDVSGWYKLREQTKGSREKQWVYYYSGNTPSNIEIYLFKESHKRYPNEFWAEIIASRIGELIGVPTPETYCARLEDKYAALVKFFLRVEWDHKNECYIVENLFEGGDSMVRRDPTFERKRGERHNIFDVESVFKEMKKETLFGDFLKILIFDTIIGNTDRHQDNWGFIVGKDEAFKLAPAYDNSTSLGSELVEEKLDGFLENNAIKLRKYIAKGCPHLRWSKDGSNLERLNHFQFLENLCKDKPFAIHFIKEMTIFTDEQVENILSGLCQINITNPKYCLSETRRKLIKSIICARRDLLKERFRLL
jgi:hypothetical protein